MEALGSKYPIVIISHLNCELVCCHLDGYRGNREALLGRLHEIEAAFASKPVSAVHRVWYNLDDNQLDSPALEAVTRSVAGMRLHIHMIAFVGLRGLTRRRFDKLLERALSGNALPRAYFSDAEQAKTWLVRHA